MDIATILGMVLALLIVAVGTLLSGLSLLDLYDLASVMITFGGGILCVVAGNPLSVTMAILTPTKFAFFPRKYDPIKLIETMVNFSEQARRDGLLALEDELSSLEEEFLRKGLQLVVDGTDPELVRNILEVDMSNIQGRHESYIGWWEALNILLPAFGMIGTLLGLIGMLKNMGGDIASIGQGMAVALITTLYGSMGANIFVVPVMRKLKGAHADEMMMKQIMIEGTVSIQQGDNPRIVKEKLASFLAPSDRASLGKDDDK